MALYTLNSVERCVLTSIDMYFEYRYSIYPLDLIRVYTNTVTHESGRVE